MTTASHNEFEHKADMGCGAWAIARELIYVYANTSH